MKLADLKMELYRLERAHGEDMDVVIKVDSGPYRELTFVCTEIKEDSERFIVLEVD